MRTNGWTDRRVGPNIDLDNHMLHLRGRSQITLPIFPDFLPPTYLWLLNGYILATTYLLVTLLFAFDPPPLDMGPFTNYVTHFSKFFTTYPPLVTNSYILATTY